MPPLYDFRSKCGHLETILLDFDQYDEFEETKCTKCGEIMTKKNREICSKIQVSVSGPGKGNYNSNDWS